ncbi:MAG TPA: Gfo/Idh/MocA family oxidoreductase [Trueperaceae bacterium]
MALIGGGRWGAVHRNALRTVGADLAAVLVASEDSARRLAREWGVPATTSIDAFFDQPSDAVIVAGPNYLHARQTIASLEAGRHVLVEKPMALDTRECNAVLAAAARTGRLVAVGHEMRVFTLFAEVKRILEEGALGAPVHLKIDLWRRPYRSGAGGWKTDPAKIGSTVLEEPIHYLDLARWYLGPVAELQAWGKSRSGREGLRENLDVRLEHEGGARSWVTRSIAAYGHQVTLMVVGEEGALRASWRGRMDMDTEPVVSLTLHRGAATHEVALSRKTGHAFDVPRQTRAFLDAVSGKGRPAATGDDGCAAVALCLAVEESLQQGSSVVALR